MSLMMSADIPKSVMEKGKNGFRIDFSFEQSGQSLAQWLE
jgi:hypothetical protein